MNCGCIIQCFWGDKIKENEVGREYGMRSVEENCTQYSGGKSCGKRLLGRLGHRWEYIIKIDH
jgi:hypothetical protein